MPADLDLDFEFLRCCQRTRDQTQRFRLIQENDRSLPILFTGNRQFWPDDNLVEAIASVRLTRGSLRFHRQVPVFKFRVSSDRVERVRKAPRERSHQQIFGCPPAFETTELQRRREMNCVRSRISLGDTRLSRRPPSYNAILMFIFHSVLPSA